MPDDASERTDQYLNAANDAMRLTVDLDRLNGDLRRDAIERLEATCQQLRQLPRE